jgi:hypothetical protein
LQEILDVECGDINGKNPSGPRKLGGPDHVELQDVGSRCSGVEPLDVQLMALIGGIGRDAQLDFDAGMTFGKPIDLTSHHRGFGADGAAGERQSLDTAFFSTGNQADCHERSKNAGS